MEPSTGRFSQLRWLQTLASLAALAVGAVMVGRGLMKADAAASLWLAIAGLALVFLAISSLVMTTLLLKIEATSARHLGELRDLGDLVHKQLRQLESVVDNTRMSDAAKSLTHRDQELEALRQTIRQDIRNERWEAALNLVDEVDKRFGYKLEAERLRSELEEARREAIQEKLAEAIELIERQFQVHEWERAEREIDRLLHALPDDPKALALRSRMKELKQQHKAELRKAWDDAVRRNDTDHAIDVLKELDQYLTTTEAQTLQASARTVFKEKLLQLGVQFKFAVTEKRWQDALDVGLEIIRDFPNSRMANEVREALDVLRDHARTTTEPVGARRR